VCGEGSRVSVGLGIPVVTDESLTVCNNSDESVQLGKSLGDDF